MLSGESGLVTDGRWHRRRQRIVYTATSEALAILELRVHLGRFLPKTTHRMHSIELPDDQITTLTVSQLPVDWNAVPHRAASQSIGDAWASAAPSVAMRLPSIHVRTEYNVLLNPRHPQADALRVVESWPVQFDPRLFAGQK